jgi:hypothetical protein
MPDEQRIALFDPAHLLDAEAEVVARTALGEVAVVSQGSVMRAAFLRHLLLGLPAPVEPWAIRLPGVRIRGAHIEGALDLAGSAGPDDSGLPALALEDCAIGSLLDLSDARLARLSLRGSRIGEVKLRGMRLDGVLNIAGVTPFEAEAWIDAHGATIGGDLLGRGASLRAPPPRPGIAHRDARYALRLSGTTIAGSIDLMGGVAAIGGIALDTARVQGDVVVRGARVTAGEGDAIGAQAARFGGVVIFADGFQAEGVIWLMGAHVAGTLDMNGARLSNRTADGTGGTLAADTAVVGGSVLLRNGFISEGGVSLRGARIGNSLECDGATLINGTEDGAGVALGADHADISGAVLLRHGFTAQGGLSFIGAKLGGNLECDGATLSNATRDGMGTVLSAENVTIGGAVLLRHGFTAHGCVSLLAASVNSNVECCGALLENWSASGSRETLRLTNADVAGDVLLNQGFVSRGYVSVWGTKIRRDLDCSTAKFIGASAAGGARVAAGAMVATNLAVAGDLKFVGTSVLGRVDGEHIDVGGSLLWDDLRFPDSIEHGETTYVYRQGEDAPPRLVLAHARIGVAIVARDLTAGMPLAINLGGAHAGTLDDEGYPAGWGVGRGREGQLGRLNLDGFVYDRIGHLPPEEGDFGAVMSVLGRWITVFAPHESVGRSLQLLLRMLHIRRAPVRRRLEWVEQQHRQAGEFHPQPYRHLEKVFRAQGHYHAAREVAIAEQWATPPSNWVSRLLRPLWGLGFGFGLSPVRATATLLILLGLGTAGVWLAWKRDVLVVNASFAMTEVSGGPVFLRAVEPVATAGAPLCGKHQILPLFYAMDMMLPVIALDQEARCTVDERPGTEIWQVLSAFYSVLGKIVTSLALLTFSGVLKPKEEL